MITLLPLIEKE